MAIPMGLTAVALLWLLWRLSGQIGLMVGLIAVAVFLILVFALVLRRQVNSGLMALGLGLSLTVIGAYGLPDVGDLKTVRVATLLPSEPFDENRLAALRAAGKPVFVYFTADWCVTCKVNEATVLEREETAKLFADNDVAVLRGDFTQRSPAIARFLALHGHAGVPLYLYYPENGAPKQLSQILTPSAIASIIKSE
jgi:thiol:disulfide interchange protein